MVHECRCKQKSQLGIALKTLSTDFPYVVFCDHETPLYLLPASLFFVDNDPTLSKSQKAKLSSHFPDGTWLEFYVDHDTRLITSYYRIEARREVVTDRCAAAKGTYVGDIVVVSPETPRRCFSEWLGLVPSDLSLLSPALPNIALKVLVALDVHLEMPSCYADSRCNLPIAHLRFELAEILHPVYGNDYLKLIYKAPWNKSLEYRPAEYIHMFDADDDGLAATISVPVKKQPSLISLLQPPKCARSVLLYMVDHHQIVWRRWPMTRVLMGVTSVKYPNRVTTEGCAFEADVFFCEFNRCHVCTWYRVPKPKRAVPNLRCRPVVVASGETYFEYAVTVSHSFHRGLYVCEPLKRCLIEDRQHLLMNVRSKLDAFPVWIRLNDESRMVARFTISSLDMDAEDGNAYAPDESLPLVCREPIVGLGVVVNACTGSVFSDSFPHLRITLMVTDRVHCRVGESIRFRAVYFQAVDTFVIVDVRPEKCNFSLRVYAALDDELLFAEILHCENVCGLPNIFYGETFGLVEDPEGLIIETLKQQQQQPFLPSGGGASDQQSQHSSTTNNEAMRLRVYLKENRDYVHRSTQFYVYSLSINAKETELLSGTAETESSSHPALPVHNSSSTISCGAELPPTHDWWKSKCHEINEIFVEVEPIIASMSRENSERN